MNTKLYKRVHTLATQMLTAAQADDSELFDRLYAQLQLLCEENESDDHKNHPVQWETLADFTEDIDQALAIYKKALTYAKARKANDYVASINYAMALLLLERGDKEQALLVAQQARDSAVGIEDQELQREIKALLASF